MRPPPGDLNKLIGKLTSYINSPRERMIPVKAVLAHLSFEHIHPFVDGSGRVGRLLQLAVLVKGGYGMRGFSSVEEQIDKNRQLYYSAIQRSKSSDATEFVELMLELVSQCSTEAKEIVLLKRDNFTRLDFLLPRRKEIVEIITDQRIVSFDFLHRRFLRISPRQLAYDLEALIKDGFIQKIGKTRGALYSVKQ